MRILITGGAGFVGSRLAFLFREKFSNAQITVLDNLKRRGSELNLSFFKSHNINFLHGDVRVYGDLSTLAGVYDVMVDASAEPSVHSGLNDSPRYVIETNLNGTINCLEFAKKNAGFFIFLSTSRVYSLSELLKIKLIESETRFEIAENQTQQGCTVQGISENFSTQYVRSYYGASKLAAEIFVEEYARHNNLKSVINRCGVIAGAGQFGKTDQGIFTLWMANHFYKKELKYTGFGGTGKQVRDILHPSDLFKLLEKQIEAQDRLRADIFNVGGGLKSSTSMQELTNTCQNITGNKVGIAQSLATSSVDIPFFVTDCSKAQKEFAWQPRENVQSIMSEIYKWLKENEIQLSNIF